MLPLLFAAALLASPALAEAPRYDISAIPAGTVMVVQNASGGIFTKTYLPPEDGIHRIEFRGGRSGDGTVFATEHRDAAGNLVRYESLAETTTFDPHDCSQVIGSCRFRIATEPKRNSFRLERTSRDAGDGRVAYELYLQVVTGSTLVETGVITAGRWGAPERHELTRGQTTIDQRVIEIRTPQARP